MTEILALLGNDSIVLDVGAGAGSFDYASFAGSVVRLDICLTPGSGRAVCADAALLPFRNRSFDAIVANHSLEHVEALPHVVAELGRVIKPEGFLYVSVPDATTLSDHIYRWLGRGGGHINPFVRESDIRTLIAGATTLPHQGTRVLFSSLSFLGPRSRRGRWQWKLMLFLGASHRMVATLAGLLRSLDSRFGSRFSVYGWEYYFGLANLELDLKSAATNVCSNCGSSERQSALVRNGLLRRHWTGIPTFRCRCCGAQNVATREVPNPYAFGASRIGNDRSHGLPALF